ncbi:hypothetical protein L1047_01635 [Synechococcus sp. Nb3U1]|uniref:hypothetical protein n=1 Tax=Synechococcus sp. Nb3U1 TaxID=1914529 RepID=UPI001F2257C4|nr:hypothetical protein [Synechococcus sp. Nb3U1]MCF2969896.1 hypothetical protein [Synechococcus sp. Nb3U1]
MNDVDISRPGRLKNLSQPCKKGRRIGWILLLGSLLVLGNGLAFAQLQLDLGTSTTIPPEKAPPVLPPPPVGVRQISIDTDPAQTADMPLSLMGEHVLEAVCEAQIDAQRALALMPDLSESHIRAACPKRLIPKS